MYATVNAIVEFGPFKNTVNVNGLVRYMSKYPQYYGQLGAQTFKVRNSDECSQEVQRTIRFGKRRQVPPVRLILCILNNIHPQHPLHGTKYCSCGSNTAFTECCKLRLIRTCSTAACANPLHCRVMIPADKPLDVPREERAIARVCEMDTLLNKLRPANISDLEQLYQLSESCASLRGKVYLCQQLGLDVSLRLARDVIIYAHAQRKYDAGESTPLDEDVVSGIHPLLRRYTNATASQATQTLMYEHAEIVAKRISAGEKVCISKYVRGLRDGIVFISESSFRYAIQQSLRPGGVSNNKTARRKIFSRARALAIEHPELSPGAIVQRFREKAKELGVQTNSIFRSIRNARQRKATVLEAANRVGLI